MTAHDKRIDTVKAVAKASSISVHKQTLSRTIMYGTSLSGINHSVFFGIATPVSA
jgi:hypothetical protein